jgi:hypothetical protein
MLRDQSVSQIWVVYAYNPSYSGGKDLEDKVRRQPGQIVHETLSRKKPITKKGWWSGPKPQKKKKKREMRYGFFTDQF